MKFGMVKRQFEQKILRHLLSENSEIKENNCCLLATQKKRHMHLDINKPFRFKLGSMIYNNELYILM